jgi:DeoR/GlpR family transcriptional regulator of sugar metabolism
MPKERNVIAEQRRRAIADLAAKHGSIRVSELTEMFGVDETTIRRDLAALAGRGILKRSHGGAVVRAVDAPETHVRHESVFSSRMFEYAAEKQGIGVRAAELVEDGSTVVIDAGTTAVYMARALRDKRDLVVVTNAITTAMELVDNPDITLVLTGGVVRRATGGAAGDLALVTLRELRVDKAFITTHSVSMDSGLTEPSFDEVSVKRAMIDAASEVVLLADHSKFGREALARIAPLSAIDHIVTSAGIDPALVEAISETGICVSVADPIPLDIPTP